MNHDRTAHPLQEDSKSCGLNMDAGPEVADVRRWKHRGEQSWCFRSFGSSESCCGEFPQHFSSVDSAPAVWTGGAVKYTHDNSAVLHWSGSTSSAAQGFPVSRTGTFTNMTTDFAPSGYMSLPSRSSTPSQYAQSTLRSRMALRRRKNACPK